MLVKTKEGIKNIPADIAGRLIARGEVEAYVEVEAKPAKHIEKPVKKAVNKPVKKAKK